MLGLGGPGTLQHLRPFSINLQSCLPGTWPPRDYGSSYAMGEHIAMDVSDIRLREVITASIPADARYADQSG